MRIIGIDPGVSITGFAIMDFNNNKINLVKFGVIKASNKNFPEKIKEINMKIERIIQKYKPREAGIEKIFFYNNKKTAMEVAQVRGSIILTLIKNKIKIFDYTPLQVKQSITGYGNASKTQVQNMIKILLKLKETPKPDDAADAIALCMCHLNSLKFNNIINANL